VRPVRLARRRVEEPAAPAAAETPPGRTARLTTAVLPPLLAFVAANVLVWHAASSAGYDFWDPRTWALWDSNQYLSQARQGLTLVPCKVPPYKPGQWCGNAGWFPLYPALVRGVSWTGLPLDWSGVVVAQTACLALLAVVWRMLGARLTAAAVLCLALAAVFPGMVYDHAVFPISLASLATLLCLHWLARGRWVAAGLAGAVAAASYPVGALLIGVVPVWMLVAARHGGGVRWLGRTVLVTGLVAAGLLAVLATAYWQTGAWDAYLKVQARYGNTRLHNPIDTYRWGIATKAAPLDGYGRPIPDHVDTQEAPRRQYEVVAGLVLLGVGAVAARRLLTRTPVTPLDWAVMLCVVAFWVAQLATGVRVHHYRGDYMLVPVVLLIRYLPRPVQAVLVAVCAVLAWHMVVLFCRAILV
jgi:hypothetical protein